MNIDIHDLNRMIADFVQVGYMQAVKVYDPPQDKVRKSEVKKWLRVANLDQRRFDRLVKAEIIKPFRTGESKNSPFFYSKKEIKQAFSMAAIGEMITKNRITNDNGSEN